jgi:hypothetical protein
MIMGASFAGHRVGVADGSFPYTTLSTDFLVAATSLTAARAITLSSGVAGRMWVFKDESGNCSATNTITITPASGTIDGFTSVTINVPYGVARIYTDGTNYFTE